MIVLPAIWCLLVSTLVLCRSQQTFCGYQDLCTVVWQPGTVCLFQIQAKNLPLYVLLLPFCGFPALVNFALDTCCYLVLLVIG